MEKKKNLIQNPTDQQKDCERVEFEVHEIYTVAVLVSSEGKAKDAGQRTTVYK